MTNKLKTCAAVKEHLEFNGVWFDKVNHNKGYKNAFTARKTYTKYDWYRPIRLTAELIKIAIPGVKIIETMEIWDKRYEIIIHKIVFQLL